MRTQSALLDRHEREDFTLACVLIGAINALAPNSTLEIASQ
ncbi:hypothetical protein BN1232_00264 [Mycobacterium lentiflavum]|uniref:Uncharacterized protein n=1 Tax=Mycobacterium lentiflavum TaxID=141349 RepID=A0A0E4GXD5_MYCLN|nr:hypothetical protein BN1232_00264 [Mycobacterium lentiflavum]